MEFDIGLEGDSESEGREWASGRKGREKKSKRGRARETEEREGDRGITECNPGRQGRIERDKSIQHGVRRFMYTDRLTRTSPLMTVRSNSVLQIHLLQVSRPVFIQLSSH